MNLLWEDMIRVETGQFVCRIWRGQSGSRDVTSNHDLTVAAKVYLAEPAMSATTAASQIVHFEGVNSVEVIDRFTGCGICVHKDWP